MPSKGRWSTASTIFLATQKDPKIDDPQAEDLYEVGTLGQVIQMLKLPDGTVKVLVEGKAAGQHSAFRYGEKSVFMPRSRLLPDERTALRRVEALMRSVLAAFENYVKLSKKVPPEMVTSVDRGSTTRGVLPIR